MDPKFKIGDRVNVAAIDRDEAEYPLNGVISKIKDSWGDEDAGEIYYLIELDEMPPSMSHLAPPWTIDAAEWEITTINKPFKIWKMPKIIG